MLSKIAFQYFDEQYKPELCKEMIVFCASGKSPESFASEKDLSPEIFAYWSKIHPEFEIALHISFWKSYSWWESQAMQNKLNPHIYKAVMHNRFKWKDGTEDLQRVVKYMSDNELEDLARRLLAQKDNEKAVITIDAEDFDDD